MSSGQDKHVKFGADWTWWPFLKRKAAYVIKPALLQLTEHYICESKAYYNNLHLTKHNGQMYNC